MEGYIPGAIPVDVVDTTRPPPTPYIFPSQMLWRVMSHMSPILRNTLDVPYLIPTQMMSYCLPESELVRNSISSADLHNPININS